MFRDLKETILKYVRRLERPYDTTRKYQPREGKKGDRGCTAGSAGKGA